MRGCLAVLVLAALFALGATWFAGPPLAAGIVTVGLGIAGFEAEDTKVTVVADPPTDLFGGRADEVRIRARDATFGGLTATTLDLVLGDVGIVERTAGTVSGRLEGVVVGAADERLAVSSIAIDGGGDEADAVARVAADSVEALAASAIESSAGVVPDSIALVAPGMLTLSLAGVSGQARLDVDDAGNLVAGGVPGAAGPIVLVAAASAVPFQLDEVAVEGTELVVSGTLDVASLLR